jgi:hypothetical protein
MKQIRLGLDERQDASVHNNRAYFDDWTAARPSSEWPTRQAPSSPERAESNGRIVGLTLVPQPGADCRRRHKRIAGPFDGLRIGALETPVRLYDLSRGGCFINSMHQQQPGVKMLLKIHLPYEGWIDVTAETLYWRDEFGFAVRFVEIGSHASTRLERALHAMEQRAPHEA